MTDEEQSDSDQPGGPEKTVEFKFDEKLQDSVQAGFGALQQVFAGFAKMARNALGPEIVRNLQAGAWLGSVADCLEAITASKTVSGTQSGELACYAERLEEELAGSKFAAQIPSFSKRLNAAVAAAERAMKAGGAMTQEDAQTVAEAAGYYRASAKSVISISTGGATDSK